MYFPNFVTDKLFNSFSFIIYFWRNLLLEFLYKLHSSGWARYCVPLFCSLDWNWLLKMYPHFNPPPHHPALNPRFPPLASQPLTARRIEPERRFTRWNTGWAILRGVLLSARIWLFTFYSTKLLIFLEY